MTFMAAWQLASALAPKFSFWMVSSSVLFTLTTKRCHLSEGKLAFFALVKKSSVNSSILNFLSVSVAMKRL